MRGISVFLISLLIPYSCWAKLPLFTEINMPDGSKAPLNIAINELIDAVDKYKESLDLGSDFEAGRYFDEYHRALFRSNKDIRGELPESIYLPLLKNYFQYASNSGAEDFTSRFQFLIYQAKGLAVDLPTDIYLMQDQLLLQGIIFQLRKQSISAYNIESWTKRLNDPSKGFELILGILDQYQFDMNYSPYPEKIGFRFSGLMKYLLKHYPLNQEREVLFLQMTLNITNIEILPWYRKAKVEFNLPLLQGTSIFCNYGLAKLQKHLSAPDLYTKEQLLKNYKDMILYGASLDAICGESSLRQSLNQFGEQNPEHQELIYDIFKVENNLFPIFG